MPKSNTPKNEEFLPLRDEVFNTLRREILTGVMQPGERLMEIHLADRLGVSRTPIREAIRMLELEGLVTMVPRRGAQVAQMTEKSMNDVLEVRRALDVLCVQLACERITQSGLQTLREACEKFESAVGSGADNRVIAQADVDFHNVIIRATKNERLIALEETLSQPMYRYRYEYIKDAEGHANLVSEHRSILESIMSGDAQAAAEAVQIHIDNQRRSIIRQIRMEKT
ncbi:MAG: GntR family transcriptional regulator [Lachnospiraceae bacterium]|nr:GntR family transcriptional regulator [Lachnospiraceae bacterium]